MGDAIDHDGNGGIRTLTFDVDVWKELDNGKDPEPVIREEMKEYLNYPDDNFVRICRFESMPTHLIDLFIEDNGGLNHKKFKSYLLNWGEDDDGE